MEDRCVASLCLAPGIPKQTPAHLKALSSSAVVPCTVTLPACVWPLKEMAAEERNKEREQHREFETEG